MAKPKMEVIKESGVEIIEESFLDEDEDDLEMSDEDFGENVEEILNRQRQEQSEEFELTMEQDGVDPDEDDEDDEAETAAKISKAEIFKNLSGPEIATLCREVEEMLSDIGTKRTSNNDSKKAKLSDAENRGLNKEACEQGHKFLGWKTKKQDNYLLSFVSYLISNGYDAQSDMFMVSGAKSGSAPASSIELPPITDELANEFMGTGLVDYHLDDNQLVSIPAWSKTAVDFLEVIKTGRLPEFTPASS